MSISVYYGNMESANENERLLPAPQISINYEPIYSNENIIGIKQVVSLNGTISLYRRIEEQVLAQDVGIQKFYAQSNGTEIIATESGVDDAIYTEDARIIVISSGDLDFNYVIQNESEQNAAPNLRGASSGINFVNNLFSLCSGNCLTIRDSGSNVVFSACGGKVRSLSYNESDNAWSQTIPYTAEIEFDYIEFFGEDLKCSTFWDNSNYDTNLVDIEKYPLKSFNDSWSITLDKESSFNYIDKSDIGENLQISNQIINVSYNISAEGSNYYKPNTAPSEFRPAWETAKHFVQDRLYKQVTRLLDGVLCVNSATGGLVNCEATRSPSNIYTDNSTGILQNLQGDYGVFNEQISCSTSELGGSFNATYTSILKRKSTGLFDSNNTTHTISKNINYTSPNVVTTDMDVSINGTIQGFIPGGLITTSYYSFKLPQNGSFLIKQNGTDDAYKYALNLWNNIKNPNRDDISDTFKVRLGITNDIFPYRSNSLNYPAARSCSLTRNYIDGTIEYNLTYDNKGFLAEDESQANVIRNVTINFTDSVPVFAEFLVPDIGIILQDINTVTGKEIAYTITGRDNSYIIDMGSSLQSQDILNIANLPIEIPTLLTNFPVYELNGTPYLEKTKSFSCNPTNGTYTMNITYVCSSSTGCPV